MSIDITAANTYFGSSVHARSEIWTRIPADRRVAALAHAARLIASRLEDTLETDTTSDGDFPRHDAAVFEQALWMLENEIAAVELHDAVFSQSQKGGSFASNVKTLHRSTGSIAPEALRFLVHNPRSVRLAGG